MESVNIVPNGPTGELIKNKNFINFITKNIVFNYGLKGETHFPGAQPVSIEKKDFTKFTDYKYFVSLKTNGTRFIMYFIKDKNENNMCILINRAMQFYSIDITGEDSLYNGTILDGELCYDDSKWKFIIHDGLMLCGSKINRNTFSSRLYEY